MKKITLIGTLLLTCSLALGQDRFGTGGFGDGSLWRDSSGVLVPVPAGKPALFKSPSSGIAGFWGRNTSAPWSGSVSTANANDSVRAAYFIGDGSLLTGISQYWSRAGGTLTPATATDTAYADYGQFGYGLRIGTPLSALPANTYLWVDGGKYFRWGGGDGYATTGGYLFNSFAGNLGTTILGSRDGGADVDVLTYNKNGATFAKLITASQSLNVTDTLRINGSDFVLPTRAVSALSVTPTTTSGQFGWWTRPAGWSYLTPATATDTLRVPVIWGGTSSALFMDASRNLTAGTGTFTGALTAPTLSLNSASVSTSILGVKGTNAKLNLQTWERGSSATAVASIDTNGRLALGTTIGADLAGLLTLGSGTGNVDTRVYLYGSSGAGFNMYVGSTLVGQSKVTGNDWVLTSVVSNDDADILFNVKDATRAFSIKGRGDVSVGVIAPLSTERFRVQASINNANIFTGYRYGASGAGTLVASIDTNGVAVFTGNKISGVIVGDSIQVTATGITTATGDAIVCYRNSTSLLADTAASFRINTAGKITLTGKHGKTVNAFITSK